MNNQKMDEDVRWAVRGDGHWAGNWGVTGAVNRAVHGAVRWAVRGDVHEAVDDDSNHPGLQDFLLEVGAEG